MNTIKCSNAYLFESIDEVIQTAIWGAKLSIRRESYETMTFLDPSDCDKTLVDETMTVDTSNYLFEYKELVQHQDEKVFCQADGKEYLCHVFTIRRVEKPDNMVLRDIIETYYYAI